MAPHAASTPGSASGFSQEPIENAALSRNKNRMENKVAFFTIEFFMDNSRRTY